MTTVTPESPAALACHRCGYDLRTQPADGVCPECGEPVAESARLAAIPVRPAWRDSDPRWRRRMLVGLWILCFLPLPYLIEAALPQLPGGRDVRVVRWTHYLLDERFLGYTYVTCVHMIALPLLFTRDTASIPSPLHVVRRIGAVVAGAFVAAGVVTIASHLVDVATHFQRQVDSDAGPLLRMVDALLNDGWWPRARRLLGLLGGITFALLLLVLDDAVVRVRPIRSRAVRTAALSAVGLHCILAEGLAVGWQGPLGIDYLMFDGFFNPVELIDNFDSMLFGFDAKFNRGFERSDFERVVLLVLEGTKYGLLLLVTLRLTLAQIRSWRRRPVPA